MRRSLASVTLVLATAQFVPAQRIDSIHVFREIPTMGYNSASAATTAWQLHHARAPFATIQGAELEAVNDALAERKPDRHVQARLPKLAYLGLAYSNGGIHVVGLMEDLDLVVNFTAHREYRLDEWTDRLKVRALLLTLML